MNIKVTVDGFTSLFVRRFAGPFWLRRRELAKTQWLGKQQLDDIQLNQLQRLVTYCHRNVPYYKKLMDERGIRPEHIKSLDDIKLFPVLSRQDVLDAGDSLFSRKYPELFLRRAYTGGTTGTPMVIKRSLFSIGNEHAFVRRQWDWAGVGFGDRCAYLTGRLIVKPDQIDKQLYAYDPIMKELVLSTYHLSLDTARDYAKVMKAYNVKAVVGYPSSVYFLAKTCLDSGIELKLESALTSSETLTVSMRETIARAFNCKVFDFYGSAERVCYIFTCEKGSYHIVPEYGLTELIPIDGPDDKQCRVISTGFWNMAMPFIRYDLDDIVTRSEKTCPCGRQFAVVESISGRKGDVIRTPSGREFGAAILTHLLYGTDHIVESQILQETIDHVVIKYVPSEKFLNKDKEDFRNLIVKHLPSELKVDFEQVESIERTESGKIRPVVSKIS